MRNACVICTKTPKRSGTYAAKSYAVKHLVGYGTKKITGEKKTVCIFSATRNINKVKKKVAHIPIYDHI